MIQVKIETPMPEACIDCLFCISGEKCLIKDIRFGWQDNWIDTHRPDWCPLEEVENTHD